MINHYGDEVMQVYEIGERLNFPATRLGQIEVALGPSAIRLRFDD